MDLLYTIGADASNFNTNVKGLAGTAQTASNQVSASLAQASQATDKLGGSAISASMRFQQMRSGLSAMRDGTLAFAVGGQRADMMLMAMGHHITSLVNETGSLSGAFKALGSSLLGPGGVILGLTVAYEIFKHLEKGEKEAYDATKHFKTAVEEQTSVINNLDDSYAKAVSNVYELRANIDLAKKGFIDKNSVVKEYNETLGKTMGIVTSLDEVEKKLISGSDAYIKMMLYKAAATSALKEATDKAVEAAKEANKPQEAFKPNSLTQFSIGNSSAPGFVPGQSPISDADRQKQIAAIAESNRKIEVDKYTKEQNDLLKIFKDFQDKAAQIAKDNKWSFTGKDVDLIEQIRQKIKQLQEDILANPSNKTADLLQIKALKKQLEDLNPSTKQATSGLALLEKQLREAETALENSLILGKTKKGDSDSPLVRKVQQASGAIKKFKEDIDEVLGGIKLNPDEIKRSINNIKTTEHPLAGQDATSQPNDESAPENLIENNEILTSMNDQVKAMRKLIDLKMSSRALTKSYNQDLKNEATAGKEIVKVFGQGLSNAFESALSGTSSFISAMGQFLLQLIEKLIAAAAAAAILAALLSVTGFASLGNFSSIFGALSGLGSLGKAASSSSDLPTHASGGIFTSAHAGIFGEAGPEAIVTPKHLQDFAGVSGNNNSHEVTIKPFQVGPVMWFKQGVRSDKYIKRTS